MQLRDHTMTQGVLVDSGADESLMDWGLAKRLGITTVPLTSPVDASALDGKLLFRVTHITEPVQVTIDDIHTERLRFHLFDSALHPIVLGFPWLLRHNPNIDWRSGNIKNWAPNCKVTCIASPGNSRQSVNQTDKPNRVTTDIKSMSESVYADLSRVPTCYLDLTCSTLTPFTPTVFRGRFGAGA